MKRRLKKQKPTKGTPSAVLLSIVIHVGLFLLAGSLVVFTVVKQKEVEFAPPKAVERPKMKLKKPKVKIKKSSKPKPTTRIVTKVQKANMPDIQLPEMSGMGEGLGGGIDGFDIMPDLGETTLFGDGMSIGNDFVGTFYHFLRNRDGSRNYLMDDYKFMETLHDFVSNGWKASDLSRYYHSPIKLYATTCMFPVMESVMALKAFGELDAFKGSHEAFDYSWVVVYRGKLVCPVAYTNGITFRFWGAGDSVLVVRVDGKVVLNAMYDPTSSFNLAPRWQSTSADSQKYFLGAGKSTVGDWITLEPGKPLDMEYLFLDWAGVSFGAMLLVEVKGEEYERGPQGNPLLPIFKTAEPSRDLVDRILKYLAPGELSLEGGPVFCDFDASSKIVAPPEPAETKPNAPESPDEDGVRSWTLKDGKTMEAEFAVVVGGQAVLKTARGKTRKIPLARFSKADQEYIELARPPKFNIDFSKKSSMRMVPPGRYSGTAEVRLYDYTFSARLKQISAGEYNHELTVEFFAIGSELRSNSNNYILLDRQKATFTPAKEPGRSFEFSGKPILLCNSILYSQRLGEKYSTYLITVTDERGKIIQYASPNKWLFENLENLKKLPVGKCMDKTCTRTYPTQPKSWRY